MAGRRLQCPDGRPVQRPDGRTENLLTRAELRELRLQPADGQEPVASLMAGRPVRYAPLYERSGAQAMPALTGARLDKWQLARTCARCGQVSDTTPWRLVGRGEQRRRLCPESEAREAVARWRALVAAGHRQAAVRWARSVVDDPRAVILTYDTRWQQHRLDVHARTMADEVLLDATIMMSHTSVLAGGGTVNAVDVLAELRTLAGRRIIGRPHVLQSYTSDSLRIAGVGWADRPLLAGRPDDGDVLGHLARWLAVPRLITYPWGIGVDIDAVTPAAGQPPADVAAGTVQLIRDMAADDHAIGAPACPALVAPTGYDVCGRPLAVLDGGWLAGTCTQHQP